MSTSTERFVVASAIALFVHALLLFGIGFSQWQQSGVDLKRVLSITLLNSDFSKRPEQAETRAQQDQTASGNAKIANEQLRELPPELAELQGLAPPPAETSTAFSATEFEADSPLTQGGAGAAVLSTEQAEWAISYATQAPNGGEALGFQLSENRQLDPNRPESADLMAEQPSVNADGVDDKLRPAAFGSPGTEYEEAWRRWMQAMGNRHYPAEAKRLGLRGSVVLRVTLSEAGTLRDLRIQRSSGQPLLDAAALRTIRRAGQYQGFPAELREQTDRVEFAYEWRFGAR